MNQFALMCKYEYIASICCSAVDRSFSLTSHSGDRLWLSAKSFRYGLVDLWVASSLTLRGDCKTVSDKRLGKQKSPSGTELPEGLFTKSWLPGTYFRASHPMTGSCLRIRISGYRVECP